MNKSVCSKEPLCNQWYPLQYLKNLCNISIYFSYFMRKDSLMVSSCLVCLFAHLPPQFETFGGFLDFHEIWHGRHHHRCHTTIIFSDLLLSVIPTRYSHASFFSTCYKRSEAQCGDRSLKKYATFVLVTSLQTVKQKYYLFIYL